MPEIRCLAHGKLSGAGRPCLPQFTRSSWIKFPSFTCSLSSGVPCLPTGETPRACPSTVKSFCFQLCGPRLRADGKLESSRGSSSDMSRQRDDRGKGAERKVTEQLKLLSPSPTLLCVIRACTFSSLRSSLSPIRTNTDWISIILTLV